jgi:hypothetical protein
VLSGHLALGLVPPSSRDFAHRRGAADPEDSIRIYRLHLPAYRSAVDHGEATDLQGTSVRRRGRGAVGKASVQWSEARQGEAEGGQTDFQASRSAQGLRR